MRKGIIICILLLSFLTSVQAQQRSTISGTVIDKSTEQPISDVQLIWSNDSSSFSVITDKSGSFRIMLSSGTYVLSTDHVSYQNGATEFRVLGDREITLELESNVELQEEVIVQAIRAKPKVPVTFSNLDKAEIRKNNMGQDLPFVLSQTPSMLVTSDAGAGVGYTGMRIRGVDPTRINVTINGIPLNDAESHGVFWVDLPDIASSVSSIQIQRGVGTSTNGAAAFGASVNLKTDAIAVNPFARVTLGAGSFNTSRYGVEFGTGLINGQWGLQGRVSGIKSDGFIDRASSDLSSMFLTAGRYWKKSLLKLVVMKGFERTYQAWYGVPQPKFKGDQGALTTLMDDLGIYGSYRENLENSDNSTYNYYTYENEVDNYNQDHYQGFFTHQFNKRLSLKTAVHYTRGYGYYEQFQNTENWLDDTDFAFYGMDTLFIRGDTISDGNFIRRRWLDNHFYGAMASMEHRRSSRVWNLGIAAQQYEGEHYGEVIWAEYASNSELGDRYYQNTALKQEANAFLKHTRTIKKKVTAFADLQVRWINYEFVGPDRNHNPIDRKEDFLFFNPKVGLSYKLGAFTNAYLSYAQSNREPVRTDYVESSPESRPQSECLHNIELGTRWERKRYYLRGNLYAMEYKDQLVLTGRINDVGAATRENVDRSYRRGVELEGGYTLNDKWEVAGNANFSMNKIVNYMEFVEDWDNGGQVKVVHETTDLALSPSYIASLVLNYHPLKGLDLSLIQKAVSDQFLDNSSSSDRMLEGFYLMHLRANYRFKMGKSSWELSGQVNNLLDVDYAPNGYTFGGFLGEQRASYNYVYPQAGRNFLVRLMLSI